MAVAAVCVACDALAVHAQSVDAVRAGTEFRLGGQTATVRKWDVLPYVEDEYT
jgi:hypothetical protein